jgi:glycosyltransferase involved in cell wall biosynthesis
MPTVPVDEMNTPTQKLNTNPAQATVIIPTLNEEAYLGDCLSSLAAHSGSIIEEVIVVDAGSTDNTKAIAEEHGVRFLPHPKSTIAAQRNAGAKLASTPLLAFLDADCTVTEEWSKSGTAEFDDESVVSAGAPPDIPEMDNTWVQRTWCFIKRSPRGNRQRVTWIASANVWVRKSTFDEIGGFNEAFETCEDADLGYRLSERGELVSNPEIRVQHHREPRTVSEFYRKEVWHGKNSFDGLWSGRLSLSELPSLITPIIFALSAILFVAGLAVWPFYNVYPAAIGFAGLSLAPWAYTLRAIVSKGQPSRCLHILVIYYIYFIARSDAFLRWCGRSVFR